MPRLLAQLHAAAGGNLALGVSSWLPGATAQSHAEFSSSCAAAAVRIVDPLGYLAEPQDMRVEKPSDRAVKWAPYLCSGTASTAELLDMQRERGANLLLTSGRALDSVRCPPLYRCGVRRGRRRPGRAEARGTAGPQPDRERRVAPRPQLLDALLAELIEQEQFDIWHVRVQWPSSARAWAQPTDEKLLAGYRKLAATADDEERRLLLPQTGLTGWLMLASGAAGFGSGPSGSTQAFLEPVRGGGGKPKIERYFERQLLHTVERTARSLLTGTQDTRSARARTADPCSPGQRGRTSTPGSITSSARAP